MRRLLRRTPARFRYVRSRAATGRRVDASDTCRVFTVRRFEALNGCIGRSTGERGALNPQAGPRPAEGTLCRC